MGIRNFSLYLHNFAILRTAKSIAELRTKKKSCGTSTTDLQNLTSAILHISAVTGQFQYFLVPFLISGWFKNRPKIFLGSSIYIKPKNCLKRIVAQDFWPPIFFHESTPYGYLIHTLNFFRIRRDIQILKKVVPWDKDRERDKDTDRNQDRDRGTDGDRDRAKDTEGIGTYMDYVRDTEG